MNYTASVPAPPGLSPPESSLPVDTLQDMIARKRDADRNKLRYHLTEADCNLLCTHGVPVHFSAGEVIMPGDGPMTKAYRIKSGNVGLMKEDLKMKELTRGYFLGEALFLRSAPKSMLGLYAVAATDVELVEINLPFVRQLLTLDKIMAFKVYRHLASKLSAFLFMSLSHIADDPDLQFQVLTRHLNSSSSSDLSTGSDNGSDAGSVVDEVLTSSISSTSSISIASTSSTSIPIPSPSLSDSSSSTITTTTSEDISMQLYLKIKNSKLNAQNLTPPRRKKPNRVKTTPFRSFTLDSPHGQCLLYQERIKFTCTIRQRKIKYNQILDVTQVGPTSVTIIHGIQAKTIFFKSEDDMNEFMGLVQSLRLSTSSKQSPSSSVASPLSFSYDDVTESDKVLLHSLCVKQDLKKGDVVIAEGDLFQRVYTVVSGEITSMKGERQLMKIEPGETFGVLSLFHLRPSMVNLVVTSDTATVLIIPGYKILDLVNTNFPLAVRMYKKSAHVIHAQLEHTLTGNAPIVKGTNRAFV